MMTGEQNGELWEWHTASGWEKVPGSEAAGANGVELSNDGRTLYVAAWGSQSFFRLSRGMTPPKRDDVPLGFRVDNIHWARDGSLYRRRPGRAELEGREDRPDDARDPRGREPARHAGVRRGHGGRRGRRHALGWLVSRQPHRDRPRALKRGRHADGGGRRSAADLKARRDS